MSMHEWMKPFYLDDKQNDGQMPYKWMVKEGNLYSSK